MIAAVALSKCSQTKKIYGIRFECNDNVWKYTWAFPINEKAAMHEDYDKTQIAGKILRGEEYPGCPHCGRKGFFYCGCGKMNCWNGDTRIATCNWCGSTGELSDGIQNIRISGNM